MLLPVQERCAEVVAEHAGIPATQVRPEARIVEDLGLRPARLLAAVEEALGVLFADEVVDEMPTVGALLAIVAKVPKDRIWRWPSRPARSSAASERRSVRGCLELLARGGAENASRDFYRREAWELVWFERGQDGAGKLEGLFTRRDGVPMLGDVALVGVPSHVALHEGQQYRVDGWLRHAPDGGPQLEVFAIEVLEQAPAVSLGAWDIAVHRSCTWRDERHCATGFDAALGSIGGRLGVAVLDAGVTSHGADALEDVRALWSRHVEVEELQVPFVVWNELPRRLPESLSFEALPREVPALHDELMRRVALTVDRVCDRQAVLVCGCVLVIEGRRVRMSRIGLQRVVVVRGEQVDVVAWEHSLARQYFEVHGEHQADFANIVLSGFTPPDLYERREAPFEFELPPGARLMIVAGDALKAGGPAFDEVVRRATPEAVAAGLAELAELTRNAASFVLPPRWGLFSLSPREPAAQGSAAERREEDLSGWVFRQRDRYVREGLLPKWTNPVSPHVARRLNVSRWLTVDARQVEPLHFEDPRFDGLRLFCPPHTPELVAGEMYRVEGWAEAPENPELSAVHIHASAIEARRAAPVRHFGSLRVQAHRGRIRRSKADAELLSPPISCFDALAVPERNGVSLVCLATPAEAATRAHERCRVALRPLVPGSGAPSLFTLRDEVDAPLDVELVPLAEGASRDLEDRVLRALAPLAPDALTVARFESGRLWLSLGARTRAWRVRAGGLEAMAPDEAGWGPFGEDQRLVIAWGDAIDVPASTWGACLSGGAAALARAFEMWPSLDAGAWGFVWVEALAGGPHAR